MHRREFLAAATGSAVALAGCTGGSGAEEAAIVGESITLTTTTSTYDTGLLDELNGAFERRYGVGVETVVQGTGAALETGRNGDADLIMVHARSLEDAFLREGYGVNRRDLMFNDFVLLGPPADPAGIRGIDDVGAAFATIAGERAAFVSRGDDSGTHQKEREIWEAAGLDPGGAWYREVGSGMGETLNHANLAEGAYTLADRGTYLSQRSRLETLEIVVEGPIEDGAELLRNPYGVVAVNPGVHDHVAYDLAMAYIGFLTSVTGQQLIAEYRVDGEQLFFPDAVSEDPDFQQYVPEGWEPAG